MCLDITKGRKRERERGRERGRERVGAALFEGEGEEGSKIQEQTFSTLSMFFQLPWQGRDRGREIQGERGREFEEREREREKVEREREKVQREREREKVAAGGSFGCI